MTICVCIIGLDRVERSSGAVVLSFIRSEGNSSPQILTDSPTGYASGSALIPMPMTVSVSGSIVVSISVSMRISIPALMTVSFFNFIVSINAIFSAVSLSMSASVSVSLSQHVRINPNHKDGSLSCRLPNQHQCFLFSFRLGLDHNRVSSSQINTVQLIV